jgi:hypothetical protein
MSSVSTGDEAPSALDSHVLTFAATVLTLLPAEATPQMTAAAAIAKFVSRAIPQGAGARSRRSGGPKLPVVQPHGALPQRRAQTQRRARPDQQRAGRLFHLRHHLHGLRVGHRPLTSSFPGAYRHSRCPPVDRSVRVI